MTRVVAAILMLLVATGALAVFYGRITWRRSTERLQSEVVEASLPLSTTIFDSAELSGLPAPVQRYFRLVLEDGQRIVTGVELEHVGTFNMSETEERWRPFSSTQIVIAKRPGFVWNGRISVAPAVPVMVHDAYVAGEGILKAAVFGLVPVVDVESTPEIARGELMRFFAEATWYPTALLPSQGVTWESVDDSSARATFRDADTVLEMTFAFGSDGLVSSVRADARGRTLGGSIVQTPWEGRWESYERRYGMLVPTRGEVAWVLPTGRWPYWRGEITNLEYQFAN